MMDLSQWNDTDVAPCLGQDSDGNAVETASMLGKKELSKCVLNCAMHLLPHINLAVNTEQEVDNFNIMSNLLWRAQVVLQKYVHHYLGINRTLLKVANLPGKLEIVMLTYELEFLVKEM